LCEVGVTYVLKHSSDLSQVWSAGNHSRLRCPLEDAIHCLASRALCHNES